MPPRRAALIAVVLVTGCYVSLDEGSHACAVTEIPACKEAENYSDLHSIQQNIFQSNCNGTDCHIKTTPGTLKGRFSLAEPDAYESLMGTGDGVPSQIDPLRRLVVKGDPTVPIEQDDAPNNSYLLFLLRGVPPIYGNPPYAEPPSNVGYMPQKNKTLCCQKLDAVRRWIHNGAQP